MGQARYSYPTKAAMQRVIDVAKANGIDVAGFKVSPDGTIHVMEARGMPRPANDFDRFEADL